MGLLMSSREPYSLYPPCVTPLCNRPVIGIVTQINSDGADPDRAESWLRLAGCETIFRVDSKTGEGVWKIIDYLREDGDVLRGTKKKRADRRKCLSVFFAQNFAICI